MSEVGEGAAAGVGWLPAPAKINLSLRVLARRADGYHELDGVMARLTLADGLRCDPLEADAGAAIDRLERVPSGVDAWLDRTPLPLQGDNLVLRAAVRYRAAAAQRGVRVPTLRWELVKRIPVAAGLGGGSSDAAAALRLLAARYPADVALAPLAAALGSDVPFFLQASPAARARGRGERLDPVPVPSQPLVLVNPGVGVSAADAYGWWDPAASRAARAQRASWWLGPDVVNDLEPGVAERVPAVAATLATLRDVWDGPSLMTGSGATCFALVPDEDEAHALAARLRQALPPGAWVAVSALAAASPLAAAG